MTQIGPIAPITMFVFSEVLPLAPRIELTATNIGCLASAMLYQYVIGSFGKPMRGSKKRTIAECDQHGGDSDGSSESDHIS